MTIPRGGREGRPLSGEARKAAVHVCRMGDHRFWRKKSPGLRRKYNIASKTYMEGPEKRATLAENDHVAKPSGAKTIELPWGGST